MAVVNVWAGAVTQDGALVVAKVDSSADVSVQVDTDSGFSSPVSYGPTTPSAENIARIQVSGLASETRYHFRVVHNGTPDASFPGQFRTHPVSGQAASFTIAAASCAGTVPDTPGSGAVLAANRLSNHHVFDTIRTQAIAGDWLGFFHMGDLHYYDLGSGNHGITGGGSLSNYRRAVDDVLLQTRQHDLYRNVPVTWMYDDHDWGPNDSDGDLPDRANALQAYRERTPYYPLPVAGTAEPNYQSVQIGRVLFVVWDCRSESSPGSDADTPAKVVLSGDQKAWFSSLLSTTTAEALVIVSTRQWEHPSGGDTWAGYTFDRQAVIDILATPGITGKNWLKRTCLIQGDAHSTGMSSGNSYGGFPVYQFAPLDSSVGAPQSWKNLGSFANHGQYGTLQVVDAGDQITITATGWHAAQADVDPVLLLTHSFTVETSTAPTPPPTPTPTSPIPVAEARIRNAVTWLGVHRTTGRIIAELPDVTGNPARQLSAYATSSISVPVTNGGPGHVPVQLLEACTDGRSGALVAVVNDLPLWMGLPVVRDSGSVSTIALPSVPTTEAYLLKRKVRDLARTDTDRSQVALALAQQAEALNGDGQGLGLEYDVTDTGDLITISYATSDRQTHYDAIRDLCVGGLEFEIAYDWADNSQTTVVKILRIRRRIGRTTGTPQAMFETDGAGSVISYRLTETWSEGRYANHVTALGPGQGADQPASTPAIDQAAVDSGVPWVELIVQPGNNITGQSMLDAFAQAELTRVKSGTSALSITAQLNAYPRLGVDALLGDQVSYLLESDRHPNTTVDLRLRGERRMTSWVMHPDQNTWEPGLVEDPLL